MIRMGFTGTQEGMTKPQRLLVKVALEHFLYQRKIATFWQDAEEPGGHDIEVHHGDCIGSDAELHAIAYKLGCKLVIHPPVIQDKRAFCKADEMRNALPYLDRNRAIVQATSRLLATPGGPEVTRSGTWSTIRYARKLGRPVLVIMPDGQYIEWNMLK